MSGMLEKEIKGITDELAVTMADLGKKLDEQEAHLKKHRDRDDSLAKTIEGMVKQYDEQKAGFTDFTKRIDGLEARLNRPGFGGGSGQLIKTMGQVFAESDSVKKMLSSGEFKSTPVEVGKEWSLQRKTLSSGTSSGVGAGAALVDAFRREGVIMPAVEAPQIRALIPSLPLSEGSIEYVREKQIWQLYATLATALVGAETDIVVDNANGFYPGQTIDVDGETKIIDTDGVDLDTNTITVTVAIAGAHSVGAPVTADKFVMTPETRLKPNMEVETELVTSSVRTLATMLAVTRQIMEDSRLLAAYVDQRMPEVARQSHEYQLLYGAGGSTQLTGIMADTDINSYLWSSGSVGPPPDTKLDAFRKAMTLANKSNYLSTGGVLHHDEWQEIELLKATDGQYVWASVTAGGQQVLWRVPIVVTGSIVTGFGLVGSFAMGATYWDREQANIRSTDSHKDWFGSNKIALLFEERGTLTVDRPKAFTKITFDAAPT